MAYKYDTIIFDLDGTLIDTLEDIMDSVNYVMQLHDLPAHTYAEIRSFVGNGNRNLINRSLPDGSDDALREQCYNEFLDYYLAHSMVKTAPYKGIAETVEKLASMGIKMAVVTNKTQPAAQEIIKRFFGGTIDITIGQVDGLPQKPEPDGVWLAVEKLGSERSRAVYIGDSEVDCLTARNSALPIIGCAWGFRGRKTLEENAADYIIDTPAEIADILEGR